MQDTIVQAYSPDKKNLKTLVRDMKTTTLIKIISGGQTGADQGGLIAGKRLKLETGGTAPYNWMTEAGVRPQLLQSFGLVAGPYDPSTYPKRTLLNIQNSDGTVVFGDLNSPGTKLTIKYCLDAGKPISHNPSSQNLKAFVNANQITILNVAGNRESKNRGIADSTVATIIQAFQDPK